MKSIGSTMAFLGAFAIVLNFMDRVPTVLAWIYNWGDTVAWIIKIGLIVVGGALWFMAKQQEADPIPEGEEAAGSD